MSDRDVAGAERRRLGEADAGVPWRRWGPYVSARQWGTVREDDSPDGAAWFAVPHDHARSRAYRWGEDGIAGVCDDQQNLCLALALWNGRDPILKERLFGLAGPEGNHGEDAKEYWFHLDSTPTHSYLSFLYKYPLREFPYLDLVRTNGARSRTEFEYELLDTGVFDDGRYVDVHVEYAKATPEDLVMRVTVHNRGPESATVHVLPTLWFRNTWAWGSDGSDAALEVRPRLRAAHDTDGAAGVMAVDVEHPRLGRRRWICGGAPTGALHRERDEHRAPVRHRERLALRQGRDRAVRDRGRRRRRQPRGPGDEGGGALRARHPGGRLGRRPAPAENAGETPEDGEVAAATFDADVDALIDARRAESDDFYADVIAPELGAGEREVVRRALAGMLWSKQYYAYDVERWLLEHGADAAGLRNEDWPHLRAGDVISMPDTWEYPWFAAWDLAFHCLPLAMVDPAFAKQQLGLLLERRYQHPNGQIPAYEWNFSDVNPPVHGWATYFIYQLEKSRTGQGDVAWLENQFQKLAKNFAWWVNRKDPDGNNVFQGGFLGLDNIGVFDRSAPLPTGGTLDQADGTAWMALYCQTMLQIAARARRARPGLRRAGRRLPRALRVDRARRPGPGPRSLDVGRGRRLLLRPAPAAGRIGHPAGRAVTGRAAPTGGHHRDRRRPRGPVPRDSSTWARTSSAGTPAERRCRRSAPTADAAVGFLLAMFDETQLRRILARMLDEDEFLGPYGIRSVSKVHAEHPYEFRVGAETFRVTYAPAESDTGMFGGNSNWRGPVWFPINALLIRALLNLYAFYGDDFRVECPTGSGKELTLYEVAREISDRLTRTFLRGTDGRRPVYGGMRLFQEDPHWRDLLVFPEYVHGDNGAGLGASHQTGWTGLVAVFPQLFAITRPEDIAAAGLWGSAGRVPGTGEEGP